MGKMRAPGKMKVLFNAWVLEEDDQSKGSSG